MNLFWPDRSLSLERMDLETLDPATAAAILRALERINLWLGGVRATLFHIKRFSRQWKPGQRIRFIDWGTGGADLPRAIVRWGRKAGYRLEVVGVDSHAAVLDYARRACRDYPEIKLVQADIDTFFADSEPFDYALSSLCLHHLTDAQIVELLKKSDRLCSRGLIMNDLKRSVRAWAWIWALSRLGRAHPIVQNDGPLSVRRAFRPSELQHLARQAGLTFVDVKTHFGYRLTLAGEKTADAETRRRGDAENSHQGVSPPLRVSPSPRHAVAVAVIGAGPAGSAAAIALSEIGMKVTLYEKGHFPRPKLCGGFLSPESLSDLERLGVLVGVRQRSTGPIRRVVVTSPSGKSAASSLSGEGLSVPRAILDSLLLERARAMGVDVREGIDGLNQPTTAAWTIIATGRKRTAAQSKTGGYFGVQTLMSHIPNVTDQVELHLIADGYVGLVRQGPGSVNLCAIVKQDFLRNQAHPLDNVLRSWANSNPQLAERLHSVRRISPWLAVGPVALGANQLIGTQTLYAGDAAYVVDPFVGEGITMGLRTAWLLQKAFLAGGAIGKPTADGGPRRVEAMFDSNLPNGLTPSSGENPIDFHPLSNPADMTEMNPPFVGVGRLDRLPPKR